MDTLNSLINLMLILINVGISFKVASLFLQMKFNLDEKDTYIKKIKNCIVAFIVGTSVFTIKAIIEHYFRR